MEGDYLPTSLTTWNQMNKTQNWIFLVTFMLVKCDLLLLIKRNGKARHILMRSMTIKFYLFVSE